MFVVLDVSYKISGYSNFGSGINVEYDIYCIKLALRLEIIFQHVFPPSASFFQSSFEKLICVLFAETVNSTPYHHIRQ